MICSLDVGVESGWHRLVPERDACLGEQGKQWCEALDFLQLEYWNYLLIANSGLRMCSA